MSRIWEPASERAYARVMRLGMTAEILGVIVMSAILFVSAPILLTLSLSVGAFLIVLGLLAWLWGLIWGRD